MAVDDECLTTNRDLGSDVAAAVRGGLIVSCQAASGHPLSDPRIVVALARCAELGGAVGLRIESSTNIRAVREGTDLPIVGLQKVDIGADRPFITPDFQACVRLADAGAGIIAIDTSRDNRPDRSAAAELIARVRAELNVPVMADISTIDEGLEAWAAGADLVGTTLSGYTTQSRDRPVPDLRLVAELHAAGVRVILEGRVSSPAQVERAFAAGAWAVVVGTAITDPIAITRAFAAAAPARSPDVDGFAAPGRRT